MFFKELRMKLCSTAYTERKALILISSREGDGVITQDLVKSQISFTLVYSILYYP